MSGGGGDVCMIDTDVVRMDGMCVMCVDVREEVEGRKKAFI